jgi:hypothetical protein
MPLYKSHSWWDVFAICEKCHNCYEADYALPLKQRFANVYKVPLNGVYNPEEEALNWAGPRARALREHGHEMPPSGGFSCWRESRKCLAGSRLKMIC